jgi:hypothetical protein
LRIIAAISSFSPSLSLPQKAVNFRDTQLLEIFQSSLSLLQKILNDEIQFESGKLKTNNIKNNFTPPTHFTPPLFLAAQAASLEDLVLKLLKHCLSFDFIGTIPDESSEDVGTIQIPSSWKPVISDFATISTLFSGYKRSQGSQAALVIDR